MRASIASLTVILMLLAAGTTAQAGPILGPLGSSGWQVAASSDDVAIVVDGEGVDGDGKRFVVIEIFKIFRDTVTPIEISFTQINPTETTASRIYIADEAITNLTGVAWTDFHWTVGGTNTAVFNQGLTNPTTDPASGGFLIAPFAQSEWSTNPSLSTDTLSVFDGEVAHGSTFFPGMGAGNLVIDIVGLDGQGTAAFTLKEIPTIPEPASLVLLACGAAALLRRRTGTA